MKIKNQPNIYTLEPLSPTPTTGENTNTAQKTKEPFFKHPRQHSQKAVGRFYQSIKEDTADVLAEIHGEYTLSGDDDGYDSDSDIDEVRIPDPRAFCLFRPADKEIMTDDELDSDEEYKVKI